MTGVFALIPARGGSKGVPNKNLRPLAGFPLIAWAIAAARGCPAIRRTIVTTDSPDIADAARRFGAEVPFMRPAALAGDLSPDRDYVDHALDFFGARGETPDCFILLRPTTPLREPERIARAIDDFLGVSEATSLRSVHPLPEPPQKMMGIEDGWLAGLFPHDTRAEYYNLPRQSFPTAYQPNGYVDILSSKWLRANRAGIFGPRVRAAITDLAIEVDTVEAFDFLEFQISRRRPPLLDRLTVMS